MKKRMITVLILALVLSLCACGQRAAGGSDGQDSLPSESTGITQPSGEDTTGETEEAPPKTTTEEPTEEPTTKPTEEPEKTTEPEKETEKGYLQRIERPDQSIFSGPSYDSDFVGTVEMKATYTIVEEKTDDEGNLWGRLKSGAGWVDLTDVRARNEAQEQVSANYADKALLKSGKYYAFTMQDAEDPVQLAFRAYENITDVQFTWLVYDGETMEVDQLLHTIPQMKAGEAFVADVVFYGDMTMFGLSFVDSTGTTHYYSVSVSGRNGTLVFTEYTP